MYRLLVLGESSLQDAGGRTILSVTTQPRRYGLLLYLALAGGGKSVRRDSLLSLFWPELADAGARHALRQALLHLRQSLGRETITGCRQEAVGIDPTHLSCDAVQFKAAFARGAYEEAVRLYRGDLLPGFHCDHCASEFEQWLESERALLRRSAGEAAWKAAENAAASGNAAAAGSFARACAGLARGDEALLRRSLALLGNLGDQAGAIVLYEDFARWLREEYEAAPSAETRDLIESIRRASAAAERKPEQIQPEQAADVRDDDAPPAGAPDRVDRHHPPAVVRRARRKQSAFAFVGLRSEERRV